MTFDPKVSKQNSFRGNYSRKYGILNGIMILMSLVMSLKSKLKQKLHKRKSWILCENIIEINPKPSYLKAGLCHMHAEKNSDVNSR